MHSLIHLEPATIALLGASMFMLIGHARRTSGSAVELSALTDVEWKTIFFFIGLFILVGGLVKVGVIRYLADQLVAVTQGNLAGSTMAVLWGSAILSAAVDNIPYVAAMNPLIVDLARSLHPEISDYATLVDQPDIIPLWWAFALGACLGGNGTIIGASANVVIVDIARKARLSHFIPAVFQAWVSSSISADLARTIHAYLLRRRIISPGGAFLVRLLDGLSVLRVGLICEKPRRASVSNASRRHS